MNILKILTEVDLYVVKVDISGVKTAKKVKIRSI